MDENVKQEQDPWRLAVDDKLARMEASLQANTKITTEVKDILDALRGALKVLAWVGKAAKILAPIIVLGTAVLGLVSQLKIGGKP